MREKLFVENLWQMCGLKKEWNNLHLLQQIFEYHLKKRTKSDVNWMGFIENWKNQQSEIIELRTSLMHLYGSEYQMKSHQCEFEFWTRSTGILWNCIRESLNANKRGQDGKRRILSIVADQFSRCEIKKNLNVSKIFIQNLDATMNDKNNVVMSSYNTETKTGLPGNNIFIKKILVACMRFL
ncbi:unnamed protein product [Rhizophagus irregularis]|nr:unnamed protein product [Rhizophagus irregularis]